MRDIIPFIFWPWFFASCFILVRRRVTGGSWRPMDDEKVVEPLEFPPPPTSHLPVPSLIAPSSASSRPDAPSSTREPSAPSSAPGSVMTPVDPDRPRSRTLAEAVEGIAMPCDLAPLMGTGPLDPRDVAFFTQGHPAATVGAALADEFERLGFQIRPVDERTIHAERGPDLIRARLTSAELTSSEVLREHHPSAPADALVVELTLS